MLRNSFVHIKGVGHISEQRIWRTGIRTWSEYKKKWKEVELPEKKKKRILEEIEKSQEELKAKNHKYFSEGLPVKESWRAYKEFEDSIVFLDIETTGLRFEYYDITVIGLFDGKKVNTYINGINLDDFQFELPKYSIMVTFNGSRFDVPFIQTKYPNVRFDQIHIDLRYALRRLGYKGGLKSIERQLGIKRASDVSDFRGIDAVRLWKRYRKGDDRALELLIKYNAEDIINLKRIMKIAYEDLKAQALPR